eukprot:TRINITY_DN10482_c0_g1_i2.p1 TRINITY_DN10482_c0_g1~~TRINITY_DN10482_c0_g1_i2.p1  ORF type:complete len:184 (-),score=52.86 TRINITY_DN10482_c0_g1_i2:60-611(-)
MIRRPPRSTLSSSSAASDVYKRQSQPVVFTQVLDAKKGGKGCSVSMAWDGGANGLSLRTRISIDPSATTTSVAKLATMQLNVNAYSLGVSSAVPPTEVHEGEDPAEVRVMVSANNNRKDNLDIQVALKMEPIGILFFNAPPLEMRYVPVSYTHLRAHETPEHLVCRLLLEKKKKKNARKTIVE